jgi:hypothetical protein
MRTRTRQCRMRKVHRGTRGRRPMRRTGRRAQAGLQRKTMRGTRVPACVRIQVMLNHRNGRKERGSPKRPHTAIWIIGVGGAPRVAIVVVRHVGNAREVCVRVCTAALPCRKCGEKFKFHRTQATISEWGVPKITFPAQTQTPPRTQHVAFSRQRRAQAPRALAASRRRFERR